MDVTPKKSIFEIAAKIAMFCNEADKNFVKTQYSSLREGQDRKEVGLGYDTAIE